MSIRHSNYRRVVERPARTVDERQHSLNSILLARAANHSQNKPDESRTGRPTFKEDFLLEHSGFGQQADSIEFAGCF
jgi:phage protein D